MIKIEYIIDELNSLKPKKGYVSQNFGNSYFSMENAKKIDAIREKIDSYDNLNHREYCLILTSLLYAMDKIANTVGHYDAFRQKMDSHNPIFLKVPEYYKNTGNNIYNKDANKLVREISADLVYIDTPYNSRGYENAYHVLENIAEWKKPLLPLCLSRWLRACAWMCFACWCAKAPRAWWRARLRRNWSFRPPICRST